MPANVETMFYNRETPWHGLGTRVEEALSSAEAIQMAGLDWAVQVQNLYAYHDWGYVTVPDLFGTVRLTDGRVLGAVGNHYKVVQNREAFDFMDSLLGEGVRYETAGSLEEGRRVWMLARLDGEYFAPDGTALEPYMCLMNSHDGRGSLKVCMTPVRVVCSNTLNLALSSARRSWAARHTSAIKSKIDVARDTLQLGSLYMTEATKEFARLASIAIDEVDRNGV